MSTVVEAADMTRDRQHAARQTRQFLRSGLQVFELAAGDHHVGAGFRKAPGNRLADAATAAGDQRRLACE
jgi:hypothetical protein